MARLNFEIPQPLHKQLATISSQLGYKSRVKFYIDCLTQGRIAIINNHLSNLNARITNLITSEIHAQCPAEEGEHSFSIECKVEKYDLYVYGQLVLEYKETFAGSDIQPPEYELSHLSVVFDKTSPELYYGDIEINIIIDEFEIEKRLNDLFE